jgi:hypothetical protein
MLCQMGPTGFPETSVQKYHLHCVRSLKHADPIRDSLRHGPDQNISQKRHYLTRLVFALKTVPAGEQKDTCGK